MLVAGAGVDWHGLVCEAGFFEDVHASMMVHPFPSDDADPAIIDYPIAANDDSLRSIRIILQNLIDPILAATEGRG